MQGLPWCALSSCRWWINGLAVHTATLNGPISMQKLSETHGTKSVKHHDRAECWEVCKIWTAHGQDKAGHFSPISPRWNLNARTEATLPVMEETCLSGAGCVDLMLMHHLLEPERGRERQRIASHYVVKGSQALSTQKVCFSCIINFRVLVGVRDPTQFPAEALRWHTETDRDIDRDREGEREWERVAV